MLAPRVRLSVLFSPDTRHRPHPDPTPRRRTLPHRPPHTPNQQFCHSCVGYLEEEAVKTYSHALRCIDAGRLWVDTPAPPIGVAYWKLREGATMRDLILAVRADD